MANLEDIRPTTRARVYDLVREAGVNVDDWANFKGGERKAASNPKYCYEWAFIEPGRVVVLNIWYDSMLTFPDGRVWQEQNPRMYGVDENGVNQASSIFRTRARRIEDAIRTAYSEQLPVRVIVCDGERRDRSDPNSSASKVHNRLLDRMLWAVSSYDSETGRCVLMRSLDPLPFRDQWTLEESAVEKRVVQTTAYRRSREQRDAALLRAQGRCELCDRLGFETQSGALYLETHHIVPLSEGGSDDVWNIIALCPNDHREAHFGARRDYIRKRLQEKLRAHYAEQ
jgi:5-methylcytosine-specific restriction protein A